MRIICEKNELLASVQTISPAVQYKGTLPILSNFLIETAKNKIKISSTDLEISVKCYMKGEVVEEGGITVHARRFTDIVKEFVNNEIEIRSDETNCINIKSGKSKFILAGISKTEYPPMPKLSVDDEVFLLRKDIFVSMLKKTIFAVSRDSQKYVLNGICFILDSDFRMIATDGKRLAYAATKEIKTNKKRKEAIVPTKAADSILKILSHDSKSEYIKIAVTDNQLVIEVSDVIFFSTLIEGTFPNYEQVIPKKNDFEVKLNVKNTFTAVKQVAILTADKILADKSTAIRLCFGSNVLRISASTTGLGSGEVELEIDYKGKSTEISFNPNFLKEALQNINEDFIVFKFNDYLNPAIMYPEIDRNYFYVIMPMRI
ncbi:MAG: DNA polymerase III subunit beta [Endomicrobium sp.]|jgi:DNA polymerase-3 subunit beta|nr:DNA polymerase III subunit beta [Endomicrobium sp.]